ncbi:NDR1/HIN1-like protein [Actinidia chinensis var. chinensis]|uniref:NDR1/HIN1-like protein n=1 Tax=Actinidia chinensis var. chinensis TaxID=1590841 RepID=A0A2R6P731_ACTCC|nr:NDR1/HIN1-like protein [Actinidia chinensis var. chinensis]
MSAKDCGNHHDHRKKLFRRLFLAFVGFTLLVLFLVLLIFLILRPTKPHFLLLDATVFAFNSTPTTSNLLTTTLQVTFSSRNPNARIGIYYDKLDIYASYRSQQITLPTLLPDAYQGHKDVSVWSPFLYGNAVPVAPYVAAALGEDELAGTVLVNVKVNGRVRWKVGTFVSGRYRLYVNCPAYIAFGSWNSGVPAGAGIKFQLAQSCHVDV